MEQRGLCCTVVAVHSQMIGSEALRVRPSAALIFIRLALECFESLTLGIRVLPARHERAGEMVRNPEAALPPRHDKQAPLGTLVAAGSALSSHWIPCVRFDMHWLFHKPGLSQKNFLPSYSHSCGDLCVLAIITYNGDLLLTQCSSQPAVCFDRLRFSWFSSFPSPFPFSPR